MTSQTTIFSKHYWVALPIMGTFVQMAYNLTDMIWVGEGGSKCSCNGTTSFYIWLAGHLY